MRYAEQTHWKSISGLILLALLVRVIYLQLQGANPLFATPALDELYHYQWALDIARGDWVGERAFFRAPLYSYLLGVLFWIAGPELGTTPLFYIATLLQHLGGVAACVLIYFLTLKLFGRRGVAFTAMGLAALYAPALFFEGQLLDISLQTLLLPAVLLLAIRAFTTGRPLDFLWLGLAGGVAVIARPASLPWFVLIAGLSPWLIRPPRRVRRQRALRLVSAGPNGLTGNGNGGESPSQPSAEAVPIAADVPPRFSLVWAARLGAMLGGLVIPILPVAWHNFKAERVFVPVATYAGVNFWIGNNQSADGFTSKTPERYLFFGAYEDSVELFARVKASDEAGRPLNSAEAQRYWFREGLKEIAIAPVRWLGLMVKKSILFWNAFEIKNNKNIYVYTTFNPLLRALMFFFNFGLVMPFGLTGLFLAWRRADPLAWRLTGLMLITLFLGVVFFFVNTRYRFPFAWLMLPFSAGGMAEIFDRVRALRPVKSAQNGQEPSSAKAARRVAKAVVAIAVSFILINANWFSIRQSQNLSDDYWNVANSWSDLGELAEAELYYKKALELNSKFSDAHNGLGEVYYRGGKLPEAQASFISALNTAMGDRWARVRALNNLGVTAEAMGRFDQAVLYYQQTLDIAPEHALAWQNLGDALRQMNLWLESAEAYERAHRLAPDLALPLLGLAACAAHDGDDAEALKLLSRFLANTGDAGRQEAGKIPETARLLPRISQ